MDLDSRTYSKLNQVSYGDINFEKYRRIVDAIWPLTKYVITKYQKCGALIFVIHLGKY